MKRVFSFIALASLILVACGKEEALNENEPINEQPQNGTVTLTAVMPSFVSDTKAGVASDGTFSWTVGDLIDVVYTDGESTKTIQFSCSSINSVAGDDYGEGTFVNVDKVGNEIPSGYHIKTDGNIAFYPTGYKGDPTNQIFGSPELAAKGFQMHATYDNGKIQFEHDNAILILTITNLPYFAKQIVAGGATVNVDYGTSDQASETVYLPVKAAGAAKLSIAVKDNTSAGNNIISKTTSKSVAIQAGYIYTSIPELNIGPYILLKGSAATDVTRIKLTQRTSYTTYGSNNYSWATTTLSDGSKYVTLPIGTSTWWDWLESNTDAVRVDIYSSNDDGDWLGCSDYVYIRNLQFTDIVGSHNYLKAAFRIYPISGTDSSVTISATVSKTKVWVQYWSEANYIHYWGFSSIAETDWNSCPAMSFENIGGNYFKSFVFDTKVVGETGTCMFKNIAGNAGDDYKTGNFSLDFSKYSEIYITGDSRTSLALNTTKSVASTSLGSKSVSVGSGYFEFALGDAFKENIVIKITNATSTLHAERLTLEHDLYYAL